MLRKTPLAAALAFLLARTAGHGAGLAALASLTVAVSLVGHDARASASYESLYGFDRTWNAAVRLVRVDLALKITEKDPSSGYLLFEYVSPESRGKPTPGSLEMVRPKDGDGAVKVIVQLPQMPHYHEQVLVDALARKLRSEYGEPPSRPRPSPSSIIDAGADAENP